MVASVVLRGIADMNLANAAQLAFDGATIDVSREATQCIASGRRRFEKYLSQAGGYIYGTTTAAGARAHTPLTPEAAIQRAQSVRSYGAVQAGLSGDLLSLRCRRLVIFARLSNAMTGRGKLCPETVSAIAALLHDPPPIPLRTSAGSGEVIPLTWLAAPLAEMTLGLGEPMGLVNGSPFATAMACDVALVFGRRLRMAERIFGLSIEAAQCPSGHFNPRLADHWPDPFYKDALHRLRQVMEGSERLELPHQAPTSWRVLPNVLACALQALAECSSAAEISLQSLKDNPTFLFDENDQDSDEVVSSGGFHDHRAARAIDQINSVILDIGALASQQVGRFLDGQALELPPLLGCMNERAGMEYVAWGLTGPLAAARRAAEPTSLDVSLHDPAGNQSDITSVALLAYEKHLAASRAWDDCLATLALVASLALDFRRARLPTALHSFCGPIVAMAHAGRDRTDAGGEPLRTIRERLRHLAEDASTKEFAALIPEKETPNVAG